MTTSDASVYNRRALLFPARTDDEVDDKQQIGGAFYVKIKPQGARQVDVNEEPSTARPWVLYTPWSPTLEAELTKDRRIRTARHEFEIVEANDEHDRRLELRIDCVEVR